MAAGGPSWDEVLAECEATADEAERLLRSRGALDVEAFASRSAFDLWQLSLPPLPAELTDRARAVHSRQQRIQAELIEAMTGVHQQIVMSSSTSDDRPAAQFLDLSA
jgi:hypothetical protein